MKYALVFSLIIGIISVLTLGIIWYETIVQWTIQENYKFYIEAKCYKPNTFCESQNPMMMITLLGIAVVGLIITRFCYYKFSPEITESTQKENAK